MLDSFFSLTQFAHRDLWIDGKPIWHPLSCLLEYLHSLRLEPVKAPFAEGLVSIGAGTVVEPGVYIQGPCVIGKNCVIRHGAYLRGPVLIGDGCHVGHAAEIKHSILLNGAQATHFVYVGDSILGNYVNLGAGVKCANLRLDRKEVIVQGEKTGLKKFGALIGDYSQIGCNSVLNPGTLFGKNSFAHPLSNIRGFVPEKSQVSDKGIEKLCGEPSWITAPG